MLIGLTGVMQSGKDTVGDILVQKHGFYRTAYADALKDLAEELNPTFDSGRSLEGILSWVDGDWDEAKQFPEIREYLQVLGTAIRDRDPNFWITAADVYSSFEGNTVVTDVRMPNEVEDILSKGGTVIRVVRPGTGGDNHITETALSNQDFPELVNDGTLEDLERKVGGLVSKLSAGEAA